MSARVSVLRTSSRSSVLPDFSSTASSSGAGAKWSAMAPCPCDSTMQIWVMPARAISSTAYWMMGRSTMGSSTLGTALEAGRNRVPRPAAGMTPLRMGMSRILVRHSGRIRAKPLARSALLGRLVDDAAVLAPGLRLVERDIGGAQQGGLVGAGPREAGHPDRHRDGDRPVPAEGRFEDPAPDLLRRPEPPLGIGLGQDQHELLSPVSGQHVDVPD